MAKLERLLPAEIADVVFEQASCKLHRETDVGVIKLVTRCFDTAACDTLESSLGDPLPRKPGIVLPNDGLSIAAIAPGQWYVLGPEAKLVSLHERWEGALADATALCLNLSDQLTVMRLAGATAPALLSSLIAIDFRRWAETEGRCLRTGLTDFSLFVERMKTADDFRLVVDQSYGAIAEALLADAAKGGLWEDTTPAVSR